MKTRIISALVAAALFAVVLFLNIYTSVPLIVGACIVSAIAVFEVLYNTGVNTYLPMVVTSVAYAALVPLAFTGYISREFIVISTIAVACVAFSFGVFAHTKVSVEQCIMTYALAMAVSYAFGTLLEILSTKGKTGLLHTLLLCGFAWGTDTGAYFIGVFFGKHKLAPEISPKKTIEGCIGGIAFCMIFTFIITFAFRQNIKFALLLTVLSPIFSIAGMIGDLSASLLKRAYGVKDYGKIMPGHGGIMDRFDSILFISPCFLCALHLIG